jgi:hypothetical protein
MKKITLILLSLLMVLASGVALASDISGAKYLSTITMSNTGTALTNAIATFDLSTEDMINNGMLSDNASDCSILTGSGGSDIAFMPSANSTYPWVTWVSAIGEDANLNQYLYSKDVSGGKIRYFPDSDGMTVSDDATLELSDNFTLEWSGYVDTDNGTDKYLLQKDEAEVYVSPTVSGNITATIYNYQWVSPTGGGGTDWSDIANSYDGNTGTYASATVDTGWTNYLILTRSSTDTTEIRFWWSGSADIDEIEVDAYYNGAWNYVYGGGVEGKGAYKTVDLGDTYGVTQVRARFWDTTLGASTARWNECGLEEVLTDSVSATDISSGEHTITTSMDSPFLSLGIDATSDPIADPITPVSDNLVMNAPLWQTECSSSPFTTIDSNAFTATVSGAVWTPQGRTFDGADDYLEVAHHASQLPTTGGSIEAWIKPDSAGEGLQGKIVDKSTGLTGNNGFDFQTYNDGANDYISFRINAGAFKTTAAGAITFGDGNWYHVVATWDATGLVTIYVNGSQSGTPGISADPAGITTTNALRIGNRSGATDRTFDGTIGDVRIYNVELTPAQVSQNYNATKTKHGVTGDIYTYSTLASVPDNANDWVFCQNGSMPYVESIEVTVGGSQTGYWEWEYGTTFEDGSGNGNTATPSFRTSASDADLTGEVSSQAGLIEGDTPTANIIGGATMVGDIGTPDNLFTEGGDTYGIGDLDFGQKITDTADAAGQDATSWHIIFVFGLTLGACLGVYALTHKSKIGVRGSLLLAAIAAEGVLIYFYNQETIPGFALIPFGLIALLLIAWRKSPSPVD